MAVDPYLLPGGPRGCLVLHGFAGDPGEVLPLGRAMAIAGLTVLGLTLPGHSGRPADLAAVRWQDWRQAVLDGYDALSGRCTEIVVAGFGLGGALALLLAAERPLQRIAVWSTPYRLPLRVALRVGAFRSFDGWLHPFAAADFTLPDIQHLVLRRFAPGRNPADAAEQSQIRREVRLSVSAVEELRQVLRAYRQALPRVAAPTLICHGQEDTLVPAVAATQIAGRLGSARRELALWPSSGHFLLDGPQGLEVIARTRSFLTVA